MNKKPNVIVMFLDDLGIGDISCFNANSKIHTKNIDALAAGGMKFENSHASSSLCSPSRYSLLTGRYNWRSRLKYIVLNGDSASLIEEGRQTLAHLFKGEGYQTAAIGKWHLGMDWEFLAEEDIDYEFYGITKDSYDDGRDLSVMNGRNGIFDQKYRTHLVEGIGIDYTKPIRFGPNQVGFDYFFGTTASLDQPPYVYIENDRVTMVPTRVTGVAKLNRGSDKQQQEWELGVIADDYNHRECPEVMQRKVLETIDRFSGEDRPFFIYYPSHLVHGPILPAEPDVGSSGIGIYGDFVMQVDRYVGEIVAKLKEKNIFEDTIFVFTSDNGASAVCGYPHLLSLGHNPSHIYRGRKADIWEGGHREPTIISYPRLIKENGTTNQLVCHCDLYRTFAELLGIVLGDGEGEDSISNLALWKGEDVPVREYIVHSCGNGGLSIRNDKWKLNVVKDGGGAWNDAGSFGPFELFAIDCDVEEHHNIIGDKPEVVKELLSVLEKYIRDGRSTPGGVQANERNNPDGHWEAIGWMPGYEDYLKTLK